MARQLLLFACVVVLAAPFGCNTLSGQPQINQASIDPPVLRPGDSAVIRLTVRDKHSTIERIEGVVLEDPRITFRLRNDGVAPDEKADDNTWSMQVDVPFQAPPGEFRLEFTAYGPDGLPVSIRDRQGRITPLQQVIPIIIQYQ